MTLVQLRIPLLRYITLKHFARAAAQCHITQPSLSMQVQKLEQELGVQIFVRTNPGHHNRNRADCGGTGNKNTGRSQYAAPIGRAGKRHCRRQH